ncbi:MAG TPA: hypothetical protein EYP56_19035 [Planctomycetaceae bacterium]|nr:hypothetical protein [Planctomycetaceae bacterium]HIQ19710.1 hypothetical protein [Planctomycetota bacterium]
MKYVFANIRSLVASVVVVAAVGFSPARAQYGYDFYGDYGYYGGYPYFGYHSSTALEGYSRGLADLIRSQGLYNALSAAGASQAEEARRKAIENYKQAVETYYHVRDLNRARRTAEQERRRERVQEWLAKRQPYRPPRLSPTQLDWLTGELQWPAIFLDPAYAEPRETLDTLFRQRTAEGFLDAEAYAQAVEAGTALLEQLKSRISQYRPRDYITARRFVEAVIVEAGLPAL